jgi:uncharacterized cupredoxin-like copper-binding protein
MKKSILTLGSITILAAWLLAACGAKSVKLSVDMKDFAYTPNSYSIPAGKAVTLELKNMGTLAHEFVIMKKGTQATPPFDDDDEGNIYWEKELEPGEDATVEFTSPSEPGSYQVVCGTAGHLEQGMQATLEVK